jgi:hypothetical protein
MRRPGMAWFAAKEQIIRFNQITNHWWWNREVQVWRCRDSERCNKVNRRSGKSDNSRVLDFPLRMYFRLCQLSQSSWEAVICHHPYSQEEPDFSNLRSIIKQDQSVPSRTVWLQSSTALHCPSGPYLH